MLRQLHIEFGLDLALVLALSARSALCFFLLGRLVISWDCHRAACRAYANALSLDAKFSDVGELFWDASMQESSLTGRNLRLASGMLLAFAQDEQHGSSRVRGGTPLYPLAVYTGAEEFEWVTIDLPLSRAFVYFLAPCIDNVMKKRTLRAIDRMEKFCVNLKAVEPTDPRLQVEMSNVFGSGADNKGSHLLTLAQRGGRRTKSKNLKIQEYTVQGLPPGVI